MNVFIKACSHKYLTVGAAVSAAVFLFYPPLFAADILKIKSIKAPVDVLHPAKPNTWVPAKSGLPLNAGDVVRTGKMGRAELLMSDGSKMILWPESRVEVKQTAPSRLFGLGVGRVKSFIKKIRGGNKFEIRTPLAAASVRGTVFEMGFDEGKKAGFLDVSRGAVALSQDGREVLVHEGQRLDFLSDRPLGEPVQHASASGAERSAVRREVALGMSKEEVMSSAAEEMRLAEYQEGKTLIDAYGQRVRLEEYVIRRPKEVALADQDKAFKLVVLNERDNRFDYFYYRGVCNTTLPENLSTAFNDLSGKLGATAPAYYLSSYETGQSNTQDSVKDAASGGHLVKVDYNADGTYTLTDNNNASNAKTVDVDEPSSLGGVLYHKIYDPIHDRYVNVTDAQYLAGDYQPVVYDPSNDTFRYAVAGDTYWRTGFNSYAYTVNTSQKQAYTVKTGLNNTLTVDDDADWTFAGGYSPLSSVEYPSGSDKLHTRVTLYYGNGTKETYDTHIISDEGDTAPASAFNNIITGRAFKDELLKWNYEQVITASEFNGRKIDLVVEPKILIKSGLIK